MGMNNEQVIKAVTFMQESLDDILDIVLDEEQEKKLVGYLEKAAEINEQFGEQVSAHLHALIENLKARR